MCTFCNIDGDGEEILVQHPEKGAKKLQKKSEIFSAQPANPVKDTDTKFDLVDLTLIQREKRTFRMYF